ncbi:MAG: PRC-barrel domain-containing protein [Eubacteriales bacterium]|jgi:uncharacterized protein YrrD|nr:PRC-barrel domain-containing protein [Bacillota bacterium]MBV1727941.1 PRC-barrel domain-containing protein [Desulforudis sp.]MDQ7789616.1 PRC-barrel domain-containing protein [Clostridia bacterium]MDZ4042230.1 PRC-barrel domain-containing protein [Eubacteriales bacterium]MBU4533604.1 PRC-barrel domain-containing protein [Bacillota bacterium]
MYKKSTDLLGLPVISLDEGVKLGHVKGLVIDPPNKALAALIVESSGLFREQRFIPLAKIHSMGFDAVTISRISNAEKGASLPNIVQLWKDKITLIGSRVISENGTVLGKVQDYTINLEDGKIDGIELAESSLNRMLKGAHHVSAHQIRTLGREAVVVSDSATESMDRVDGGLEERVRQMLPKKKAKPEDPTDEI